MITLDYQELYDICRAKGYSPFHVEMLALVVKQCKIYKFRRDRSYAWQYEAVMPGYGNEPDKSKWVDSKVLR